MTTSLHPPLPPPGSGPPPAIPPVSLHQIIHTGTSQHNSRQGLVPTVLLHPYPTCCYLATFHRKSLEFCTSEQRATFLHHLGAAQQASQASVMSSCANAANQTWQVCCIELCVDPGLSQVGDPILLLQVFAHCYWMSLRPLVGPSDLARWKEPSPRWGRRWPVWGPTTLASMP
jgi:hypothetical protein